MDFKVIIKVSNLAASINDYDKMQKLIALWSFAVGH